MERWSTTTNSDTDTQNQSGVDGPQAGASWAVRESFVAIVTSNLPIIYGYLRRKLRPYFGSLLTSNNTGAVMSQGPVPGSVKIPEGGSRPYTGKIPAEGGPFKTPNESEDDVSLQEILSGKHDGIGRVTEVSRHVSEAYDGNPHGMGMVTTVAANDPERGYHSRSNSLKPNW